MKKCIHCKRELEEKSFVKTRQGNRGSVCHKCNYQRKNSEYKVRKNTRSKLKSRYDLTIEEYNEILKSQNGICAICGSDKKLIVDHDHVDGRVRGILCHCCNIGIGMMRNSPDILRAALIYLNQPI